MAEAVEERIIVGPQPGPQEQFLSTPADIAITGGAAGGGKTMGLLMDPLRHIRNPKFRGIIFRESFPQITNPGGLWEESLDLYMPLGARPNVADHTWQFPGGMKMRFSYLARDSDVQNYQGSQMPFVGFDQLEHQTEYRFWYMASRLRSVSGVAGYMRANCNPDPDSFVAELIKWWIGEDGFAIPKRSGVIRWLVRRGDDLHWSNSEHALKKQFPKSKPISFTFIPSTLEDNPILDETDPQYRAWLESLPRVERERLLLGNWKVRRSGNIFDRNDFRVAKVPPEPNQWVRYWDKAGTADGGAYTVGLLMGRTQDGEVVIKDVKRGQWSSLKRRRIMQNTAESDGRNVTIWVEQEPGSGGKESAEQSVRDLAGYVVRRDRVTGDKGSRALPFAAQVESGNVILQQADWNEPFLKECDAFDPDGPGYKDQVDAASGAYNKLHSVRRWLPVED